jgi:NTP pyrophosphatase (non-canonical NTP hydrolase)
MHMAEFLNYIDLENWRLQQRYPQLDKEKMENFSRKALASEFADLIITTFLLAKSADVDVVKALDEKIAELNLRPV